MALPATRLKRSTANNCARQTRSRTPAVAFEPAAEGPSIDEQIDRERLDERLEARTHRILQRLPESYGLALLWRYWENRSVREMAEATGKTEKAIERLLARARARFRELWDQV